MEKRRFGRTGHMSSIMIFGSVGLWSQDFAVTDRTLTRLFEHGVNHIDVAPQYGNAQRLVGAWLEPRRDLFFLNCKTLERTRDGVWKDLENSLRLLHTDTIDLHQFHAVSSMEILDEISAKGGAMEAFQAAKDQGIVRFLGITSHGMAAPAVEIAALERFDLDAVMFPLNPRLYADADYRRDAERLLQIAQDRDLAVMVIKSAAKGAWHADEPRLPSPWYRPHETYEEILAGLRFALSQPGVAAAPSVGNIDLTPLFLQAAENFTPMSPEEQAALIADRGAAEELIFVGTEFNTPD